MSEAEPQFALAIHGGAGAIAREQIGDKLEQAYRDCLRRILDSGAAMLAEGATALDVVERVVGLLEDEQLFNAGRGSVLNSDGEVEMDASIMDGATGCAGSVGAVRAVRNPVRAARAVMDGTQHVLLIGEAADTFARDAGLAMQQPDYFRVERRVTQWRKAREAGRVQLDHAATDPAANTSGGGSTVGAVARDREGRLAAATSTGGMTNKLPGRVGDSAIIGAGTWADGTCAISTTGIGERFQRAAFARHVADRVALAGESLEAATAAALHQLGEGTGGCIAVDARGHIAMPFNTSGMYRAARDGKGERAVSIWSGTR
jgi:beta-aspartyl-peptidase (threonine type)